MSEVQKFMFDGMPVRGVLVRLTDVWVEILRRRTMAGAAYPLPVQNLLGEMVAAAALMQSNIKFNGALILQVFGDGPVKLLVAEAQSDFGLRATATVVGELAPDAGLSSLVNLNNEGKCAITLDPRDRLPGQQTYQGVVRLSGEDNEKLEKLSDVLQRYMRQSEQLDTTMVLAADDRSTAGLLIQRLPIAGAANLAGTARALVDTDDVDANEDYQRIAMLASSLQRDELLGLDTDTVLRRLFWQENLRRFEPVLTDPLPHFSCACSRDRVGKMIRGLGADEVQGILAELGEVEVACEFCGAQQRFDSVDVAQLFKTDLKAPAASTARH